MKKMTPLATALVGVLTGVVCLGFIVLAKHTGIELSEFTKEALTIGGMTALLGGVAGARFMPTEAPKP